MYTILIVDDEQSDRQVITYLLKSLNIEFSILQAENGEVALSFLRQRQVDILVTDVQMPYVGGIELAQKARALSPDIEVLFFSGHDDFTYIKSAMFLKAVNYILKPVNPEEFSTSMMEIITSLDKKEKKLESFPFIDQPHCQIVTASQTADQEDHVFMEGIEEAIKFKDVTKLKVNTLSLLDKYSRQKQVSHLYIRYLCTTIISNLFKLLPNIGTEDFQNVTDKIYHIDRFSDLRLLIEDYLDQVSQMIESDFESPNHTIQLIEQYIHTHYQDDLSLATLADTVFLSPKYLSNMFAQHKGISVKKYIKKVRIDKAKELLMNTNMKIVDIGTEVGYGNVSYFCKVFQDATSMSPNSYRLHKKE